jgi:hypothetical protein
MKRKSTLSVQSEKLPAYAGRRERQWPAPRLRPREATYGSTGGHSRATARQNAESSGEAQKIVDKRMGVKRS